MPARPTRTTLTLAVAVSAGTLLLLPNAAGAAPGGGSSASPTTWSAPSTVAVPTTYATPTTVKQSTTKVPTTLAPTTSARTATTVAPKQYSVPTTSAGAARTAPGVGAGGSASGANGTTAGNGSAGAGTPTTVPVAGKSSGKGSATSTTLDPGTEALPEGAPATPALLIGGDPNIAPAGNTGKLLAPITKLWLIGLGFLLAGLLALVLTVRYARRTKPSAAAPGSRRHRVRPAAPSSAHRRGAHARHGAPRSRPAGVTRPARPAPVPTGEVVASRWRQGDQPGPRRRPMPSLAGLRDDRLDRTLEERMPTLL